MYCLGQLARGVIRFQGNQLTTSTILFTFKEKTGSFELTLKQDIFSDSQPVKNLRNGGNQEFHNCNNLRISSINK